MVSSLQDHPRRGRGHTPNLDGNLVLATAADRLGNQLVNDSDTGPRLTAHRVEVDRPLTGGVVLIPQPHGPVQPVHGLLFHPAVEREQTGQLIVEVDLSLKKLYLRTGHLNLRQPGLKRRLLRFRKSLAHFNG